MFCRRNPPVQMPTYSLDIWSLSPKLDLPVAGGSLEILYDNGVWCYGTSADTDITRLQAHIKQLEVQKLKWEDRLRDVQAECREKERAIELILGSKKCTAVPREKKIAAVHNSGREAVKESLYTEAGNSALPPSSAANAKASVF